MGWSRGQGWAQSLETAAEPSAPAADAYVALAVDVRRALAELSEGDRRLLLARYWADITHARSRISSECPTARLRFASTASAHACALPSLEA